MIPGRIVEFPAEEEPQKAIFPTYYFADTDEIAIPRLPADPDTAAAILGSWAQLLTGYGILTPDDCYETLNKVFNRKGSVNNGNPV